MGCSCLCFCCPHPGKGWREEAEAGSRSWWGEAGWGWQALRSPQAVAQKWNEVWPSRDLMFLWPGAVTVSAVGDIVGRRGDRKCGSYPFSAVGSQPTCDPSTLSERPPRDDGAHCAKHFYT